MFSSSGNETASANPAAWSLSFPGWFALPLAFDLWTNVIVIVHQKKIPTGPFSAREPERAKAES